MKSETIPITGLSNREFLERYAAPGHVGLCGGAAPVDVLIRRAQRHLDAARQWSDWSHAFVFEGVRADGRHWVMESDLQFHRRNVQLGAQENRLEKYGDETLFPTLAVLDFGLNPTQIAAVIQEGLDLVASRERYSLRELVGTLIALRKPELRAQENVLAKKRSVFCSAFVQRLFHRAAIDLAPGVSGKNTTPEDLARSPVPHVTYLLQREMPGARFRGLRKQIQVRRRRLRRAGIAG